MVAPVYSVRLGNGNLPADGLYRVVALVVAGTRVVVRTIDIAADRADAFVTVRIVVPGGPQPIWIVQTQIYVTHHLDTRQVLYEGEQLEMSSGGANVSYVISGYALTEASPTQVG